MKKHNPLENDARVLGAELPLEWDDEWADYPTRISKHKK